MTTGLSGAGIDTVIYVLIATVGTAIIFGGVTQVWGSKKHEPKRTSDNPTEVEDFYDGFREGGKKTRRKKRTKNSKRV